MVYRRALVAWTRTWGYDRESSAYGSETAGRVSRGLQSLIPNPQSLKIMDYTYHDIAKMIDHSLLNPS